MCGRYEPNIKVTSKDTYVLLQFKTVKFTFSIYKSYWSTWLVVILNKIGQTVFLFPRLKTVVFFLYTRQPINIISLYE
jgi:hypothetical protein